MPFVQAKCPECGGMLAVESDKKAAVCQFCGEAFIVQEAVNNFNNTINIESATINLSSANLENLNARAEQYERQGNNEKALEYYNRVLDFDINNQKADKAVKRLSHIIGDCQLPEKDYKTIVSYISSGEQNDYLKALRDFKIISKMELKEAKKVLDAHFELDKYCIGQHQIPPKIYELIKEYVTNKEYFQAVREFKNHSNTSLSEAKLALEQHFGITI